MKENASSEDSDEAGPGQSTPSKKNKQDFNSQTIIVVKNASDPANESGSDQDASKQPVNRNRKRTNSSVPKPTSEQKRFETALQNKLSIFIKACELICSGSLSTDRTVSTPGCSTLVEFLTRFDGVYVGLNGDMNRNALFENMQASVEKYKGLRELTLALGESKSRFEREMQKSDGEEGTEQESYFKIIELLNELINLNENEDLISN